MTAERAVQAYAAMQRHLYLKGARLYREAVPTPFDGNPFAYVWPFEEAAKAALCMRGLPGVGQRYPAEIENVVDRLAYWQPRRGEGLVRKASYASYPPFPLGKGGDTYFDDNTWIALDLVQAYRMRFAGQPRGADSGLDRARQLYELILAGWAADARPYPGGVYWVDASWNRDRGAAVTAGLAVLSLHLYELTTPDTRNPSVRTDDRQSLRRQYLDTALAAYRWLRATLWIADGSEAGLYHDKVLGDGRIDSAQWIYNQGVAVAAGVMLHRVTGDRSYLEQARQTADAALSWYRNREYQGQPAIFVAIFFRNALQLAGLTGNSAYLDAMQAYCERAWTDPAIHDAATGLFRFEGPGSASTLLDQAAMVQMLALAAWPPEQYALLA
ncbi:MAG: glycoside hydrolase family 76 protein [Chloroflexota bacterium]